MNNIIILMVVAFIVGVLFGGYIRPRLSKLLEHSYFNDPVNLTPIFDNEPKGKK